MTTRSARLRRFSPPPDPDRSLLAAFLAGRDEAAFAELVRRHGPLVFGVCRRVLGHTQDAEDAFQATFLVLARKAGSVTRTDNLSPWLYAVAVRTARELRHMRDRRRKRELAGGPRDRAGDREADQTTPAGRPPDSELAAALDEELARLPDHYRLPILLCEIQGRTRKAAAAELGIPDGTLSSRIAAAKKLLADRLTHRGVTASVAAVAAALTADARVPAVLLADTARAAAGGVAATAALRAADGVVKAMFVTKLKGLAVAVGLAFAVTGGVVLTPAGAGTTPSAADPTPAELVSQLGSPDFADREAAEKALKAMGPKAKPAVRAGMASADPEVAKRSNDLWAVIRNDEVAALAARVKADKDGTAAHDHPLWERFKAVAGDDKASRQLFAEIIDDGDRARRLARVVDEPKQAGPEYEAAVVRVSDRVMAAQERDKANPNGPRAPGGTLTLGEFAAAVFLGTFDGTGFRRDPAADLYANTREPLLFNTHPHWLEIVPGPLGKPVRRLLAAWVGRRENPRVVESVLDMLAFVETPELLPVARGIAADQGRPPGCRSAAIQHLARYGGKAELPAIAALFGEKHEVVSGAQFPGGLMSVQVGDVALRAALQLYDQDPADYGFPSVGALGYDNLKKGWKQASPALKYTRLVSGFFADADREAAHKKSREWLDGQEKPAAEKPNPEAVALVRQLGSPAFRDREAAEKKLLEMGVKAKAAVVAGLRDPDPEVARRCEAIRDHIRREEHWPRFAKLIGDDQPARDLYTRVAGQKPLAELLDAVTAAPAKAADLYFARLNELNARVPNPRSSGVDYVDLADVLGWFYLGTFADSGATRQQSTGITFQNGYVYWNDTALTRLLDKPADPAAAPVRRLLVRWLAERRDDDGQWLGLLLALQYDIPEAAAAARTFLKIPGKDAQYAPNRGRALLLLANHGTTDDLPLFSTFAEEKTECFTLWAVDPAAAPPAARAQGHGLRKVPPGGPTTQFRDIAVAAAVRLRGGDPRALGWFAREKDVNEAAAARRRTNTDPRKAGYTADRIMFETHAFNTEAEREAAHAKAKAWLANQPRPNPPAGQTAPAAAPPKPNPEAEKLVKQLGSPVFADRESAEKKLRAMGLGAKPAVKAGTKDADPEVAKRSAGILDTIRQEQFRPRFTKLIGDDADAKTLLAAICSVPRNVELIEAAEDRTADPSKLYVDRRAELNDRCTDKSNPKRTVWRPQLVSAAELAGFLYLGTFPGAADGEFAGPGENHFVMDYRDMWQNTGYPFSAALTKGPLKVGCGRLLVKWTETRTDPQELKRGLNGALAFGLADGVPFAKAYVRKVAAGQPKNYSEPFATALALVGKLGTKDDLPFLMGFADDRTVIHRVFMSYPGDEKNPPRAFRPGKDVAVEVRDAAVVAALVLCGQSRNRIDEYGFFMSRYAPRADGAALAPPGKRGWADDPLTIGDLGFVREADRDAAHKKAREWLDTQMKPPPAEKDGEVEKMVKQLGSPVFDDREAAEKKLRAMGSKAVPAVAARAKDGDPEVAARCTAILRAIRADVLADFTTALRADPNGSADFDHPIWRRFRAAVGSDGASRRLLAGVLDDPRRAKVLDDAEADPDRVPALYAAELDRISAFIEKAEKGVNIATLSPEERDRLVPPAEDVNLYFYLGTFANSGTPPGEVKGGAYPFGRPLLVRELDGRADNPQVRLLVRWLDRREAEGPLTFGLVRCQVVGARAALPVARKLFGGGKAPAETRAWALAFLGQFGTADDLKVVEQALTDTAVAMRFREGITNVPYEVQYRDTAAAVLLIRRGVDLKAFGFPALQHEFWWGTEGSAFSPWHHGFPDDTSRQALHAKARKWLAENPGPWAAVPDAEAAKLVRQLGFPAFADREAAEKRLLAIPAAAIPAVRAGQTNSDPEVAARCKTLLPRLMSAALAVSDHPAWVRFKKAVGDDANARKLFLEMTADGRRAELIDQAEADPTKADAVYATELTREVEALKKGYADAERTARGRTGELLPASGIPTRGEFATLLFLGSYPATANVTYRHLGDADRVAHHGVFGFGLRGSGDPMQRPGVIPPEVRRLYAAWLAVRADGGILAHGIREATFLDMKECLPAAKAAVEDKQTDPEARGFAALAVGHFGTKHDVPLLEKALKDDRVFHRESFTGGKDGGRLALCQVRDAVLAAVLHLNKQEPTDYGFPVLAEYKHRGDPDLMKKYHLLGFFDSEAREKAHAKAAEWLKGERK